MVQSCAAMHCTRRWDSDKKIKLHSRFPKNSSLREKWIVALKREKFIPGSTAVVCENHFRSTDYMINVHGNKVLKEGAVPSVFGLPQVKKMKRRKKRVTQSDNEKVADIDDESIQIGSSQPAVTEIKIVEAEAEMSCLHDDYQSSDNLDPEPEAPPSLSEHEDPEEEDLEPLYVDDFDEADLECSKKRKRYWTASQEAIRYHRLKEKFLKERIRQQDKRIDELESLIEKLQRNKKVESDVLFFLEVVE